MLFRSGPVLGTSEYTGAGGANVWTYGYLGRLQQLADDDDAAHTTVYSPLPRGADLRVAVRRTLCVGPNAGSILEDFGVTAKPVHRMTKEDLLDNNADLLQKAMKILSGLKPHPIAIETKARRGSPLPEVSAKTANITRLDVFVNGRPAGSHDVTRDDTTLPLDKRLSGYQGAAARVEVRGFEGDTLVARTSTVIEIGRPRGADST